MRTAPSTSAKPISSPSQASSGPPEKETPPSRRCSARGNSSDSSTLDIFPFLHYQHTHIGHTLLPTFCSPWVLVGCVGCNAIKTSINLSDAQRGLASGLARNPPSQQPLARVPPLRRLRTSTGRSAATGRPQGGSQCALRRPAAVGSPQNLVQLVFPPTSSSFRQGMDATGFSGSIPRDRLPGRRSIVPPADPALREEKSPPRITDGKG